MVANQNRIPLDVINVAKPCPADWNAMRGDGTVRFCNQCSLHVYNLSAMSRPEAERLVAETEGRLCVRFYRRADGTLITSDCGGGIRLAARRLERWASTATAVVLTAALTPLGMARWLSASPTEKEPTPACVKPIAVMGDIVTPQAIMGKIRVPASRPVMGSPVPVMGAIAVPPPVKPPTTLPATQPAEPAPVPANR